MNEKYIWEIKKMNEKYITLNYDEYLKLLDRINKVEELLNEIYENQNKNIKNKIEKYMREYCN